MTCRPLRSRWWASIEREAGRVAPLVYRCPALRSAILLSSSSSFELKELPADKASSLVFYCSNERCSASKKAAKVASENGYTDVAVLPAGIAGWVSAGLKTTMPQSYSGDHLH